MRSFIEDKMNEIFEDFKVNLNNEGRCCVLKDVRFNRGNIPDYSIPLIQQLYLLRYFPAYFVEYYDIYRDVIKGRFVDEPYNVLSIGAGCGVDYFGLEYALRCIGKNSRQCVRYTGLDRIEWRYREYFKNEQCWFLNDDICEWDEFDEENYNIIIFPKSIGEFDTDTFNNLVRICRNTKFKQRKICMISSLRELNDYTDIDRMNQIVKVMTNNHNYLCENPKEEYIHYKNSVGLRKHFPDFIYPEDIKDFLSELIEQCELYSHNMEPCDIDCITYLNRKPILTTTHIKYQIKRLYKG